MAKFLAPPTNFQDSPEWRTKVLAIEAAYPALYPGDSIIVVQNGPIKETVSGETGCTWDAASPKYPNAGTFPIGYNDTRTPGQIAVVINETLVSEEFYADNPNAVRGQSGPMPFNWPAPQWANLPDDGGQPQ